MRKLLAILGSAVVVTLVVSLIVPVGAAPVAQREGSGVSVQADGKQIFMDQKCNLCHAVSTAGIEAKTKSEKMKGPDLVGLDADADTLVKFITGETEMNGAKHKKKATGSDAEVKALVDWILSQK